MSLKNVGHGLNFSKKIFSIKYSINWTGIKIRTTLPDIKESVFLISSLEHDYAINFRIYHQSTSSIKSAMAKRGKIRGRVKYKSLKILRTKFFGYVGTKKSIFDNFVKVIFVAKIEIVNTSFNCQNKILYINSIHS